MLEIQYYVVGGLRRLRNFLLKRYIYQPFNDFLLPQPQKKVLVKVWNRTVLGQEPFSLASMKQRYSRHINGSVSTHESDSN